MKELEVIKKMVKSLKPQIEAVGVGNNRPGTSGFLSSKMTVDTRKKIDPQRRFKIKKRKITRSDVRHSEDETQKIKISAILESKRLQ